MTEQLELDFNSQSEKTDKMSFVEYMEWLDDLFVKDRELYLKELGYKKKRSNKWYVKK